MVRFGTPVLRRRGTNGIGVVDACVVCIESRDVLEKEDGPFEFRLFLLPHLKKDAQENGPLKLLSSEIFDGGPRTSVLASDSWGDLERDSLTRKEPLDPEVASAGAWCSLGSEGAVGGFVGMLSTR